jgi:hypothetical protein
MQILTPPITSHQLLRNNPSRHRATRLLEFILKEFS